MRPKKRRAFCLSSSRVLIGVQADETEKEVKQYKISKGIWGPINRLTKGNGKVLHSSFHRHSHFLRYHYHSAVKYKLVLII